MIDAQTPAGLLLVGHGTRSAAGQAEFLQVAQLIAQQRPQWHVAPCFLELAQPDIPTSVARLLSAGVERLMVAPLLLFSAGHAEHDIPEAVAQALADAPQVSVQQAGALECHAALVELSAARFAQALSARAAVPAEDTLLLMVGRGSRSASATAQMRQFAELRGASAPVAAVESCFYAMAEPSLAAMLPRVAAAGFRRVVVQPHLLFPGELLSGLQQQVAAVAAAQPDQEWIVTAPLGAAPQVAAALVARAESMLPQEDPLRC